FPRSSRNCFGRAGSSRVPRPPAAMMALFNFFNYGRLPQLARGFAKAKGPRIVHGVGFAIGLFPIFPQAAEYHLACSRLKDARDRDVGRLSDQSPGVVDDYHRAVVEIGDALVVFLAFLEDEYPHRLAR